MNKDKKNLYDDPFFSLMSWLNGAFVNLAVGGAISFILALYVHVFLGIVFALITLIWAIAAYIVFKK